MNGKMIFKVKRREDDIISGQFIRTNSSILSNINTIKKATGLSATKIVEQVLDFVADNFEVAAQDENI